METKHFTNSDWSRCTPSCTDKDIDVRLLHKLEVARELYDTPMIITSAYRSRAYERARGRTGTSSHCKGMAVDIHCSRPERMKMISALIRAGFVRIGVYPTFLHVDCDDMKSPALWVTDSSDDLSATAGEDAD